MLLKPGDSAWHQGPPHGGRGRSHRRKQMLGDRPSQGDRSCPRVEDLLDELAYLSQSEQDLTLSKDLAIFGVELRCGAAALGWTYLFSAPFVRRCLSSSAVTPFPHPAHRTGRADFPHPALGQDLTLTPTAGHT